MKNIGVVYGVAAIVILGIDLDTTQAVDLGYFLPKDAIYNKSIPTPKSVLGFNIGQRHLQHHELVRYMKAVARVSPRVTLKEYGRTYGGRPLLMLTITSVKNHQRLESIRKQHLKLANPGSADLKDEIDLKQLPAVINMGYSVHGNEPSGSNVTPVVVYHLAASEGKAIDRMLADTVILLDPSLNPDGMERFANWANNHKGRAINSDPNHREHRETWPSARTNYYLFDLNRDWLPLQHPESRGRMNIYQRWLPNVVLDFHEMGTDNSYFFQPGIPTRKHPLIPNRNVELTKRMAIFHAESLDAIGSQYFTQEKYDDFYLGKGSSYPDLHGGVGILFEQASARGHLQESVNGKISFAFAIRNHFVTSRSSLNWTAAHRQELLQYKREFYQNSLVQARDAKVQGYLIADPNDTSRLLSFLEILRRHRIKSYELGKDVTIGNKLFKKGGAFVVPARQAEYRYLTALFEKRTEFEENVFYDVSTWTLPLAFNLEYAQMSEAITDDLLGRPSSTIAPKPPTFTPNEKDLAYLIDWRGYMAPRTLRRLLDAQIMVKVARKPFAVAVGDRRRKFGYGTLLVPLGIQKKKTDQIKKILAEAARQDRSQVLGARTGLAQSGIDLGSPSFALIKKPKVLLMVNSGVSTYEAGEVWHLLDRRIGMPVSMVDVHRMGEIKLDDYTAIVMVSGTYSTLSEKAVVHLKSWLNSGGTLIAIGSAVSTLNEKKITEIPFRKADDSQPDGDKKEPKAIEGQKPVDGDAQTKPGDKTASKVAKPQPKTKGPRVRRPFAEAKHDAALQLVRGSIFQTTIDVTHPACYGYDSDSLPVFRNKNIFLERSTNPYSSPVVYSKDPLLSGYISPENLVRMQGAASVIVKQIGKGRIIVMTDNPNFRAFWYGTNRLFLNSIFFGPLMYEPKVDHED